MQVQLLKWGNSLGFRVPKGMAVELGFEAGDMLDIQLQHEGFRVQPVKARKKMSLETALTFVAPAGSYSELDWGGPQGNELL